MRCEAPARPRRRRARHRRPLPLDRRGEPAQLGVGHGHRLGDRRGLVLRLDGLRQRQRLRAVPHPRVGSGGEEARDGQRERRLPGMHVHRRAQALQGLRVAGQAHEGHRLAEPCLPPARLELQRPPVGRQRRLDPVGPAERVSQPEVRLDVIGIVGGGERVPLHRLLVAAAPLVERPHREVRAGQTGIQPNRLGELAERGAGVTRAVQGQAEVQPHDGEVGREPGRLAELPHRLGPVVPRPGVQAEVPIDLRAPERGVHLRHQRIRQGDADPVARARPTPIKIGPRPLEVAEATVGHGEGIADRRRGGLQPQRVFEKRHGAGIVPFGRGDPAELEQHCRSVRMESAGPGEVRPRPRPAGRRRCAPGPAT